MGSGSDDFWSGEMASNPSTISDFDDNLEDELQVSQANANALMDRRSMFHSGMVLSLLHQMCSAYEKDPGQREKMFRLICQEMSKLDMLPHQSIIDAFRPVQTAYTKTFRQMMQAVLDHLHNDSEPRMLSLPTTEKERTALLLQNQSPLLRQPTISSEGIVFPFTTRYESEFDQQELLGRGGFGKVYKVQSKLDGRYYAVKKIKLAHMSTEKSQKLINEVRVLSRLKHTNVVGYNTSWMEVEPIQSPSPRNSGLLRDSDSSQKGQPSSSESPRSSSELDSSSRDKARPDDSGSGDGEEWARIAMEEAWAPSFQWSTAATGQDVPASRYSRSPSDSSTTIVKSPSVAGSPVTPVAPVARGDGLLAGAGRGRPAAEREEFSFVQESRRSESRQLSLESKFGKEAGNSSKFGASAAGRWEDSSSGFDRDDELEDLEIAFQPGTSESLTGGAFSFTGPEEEELDTFDDIQIGQGVPVEDWQRRPPVSSQSGVLDLNRNHAWKAPTGQAVVHGDFGLLDMLLPKRSGVQILNLDEADNPKPEAGRHRRRRRCPRSKSQGVGASVGGRASNTVPPVLPYLASFRPVLCIQMQLCSHTLSDWLKTRNQETQQAQHSLDVVDREGNMRIFKQILDGMHYIHSNGLIHRDLKPKNIFLENSGAHLQVLIGDFGLAKEDVKADDLIDKRGSHDPSPDYPEDQSDCVSGCGRKSAANTADVGTLSYASPEQLQGSKYDCKADMYSSGIILFEMFHPFSTQMERCKVIEAVRGGNVPIEVQDRWPDQCQTICQLTHANCYKRPSADQVLKGPLFKSKDEVIRDLETKLSERDLEIQRLKRQIESLQMGKE